MLATMYEKGVGVARDADEAARWRALAEKDVGDARATS
jgi:TPR repeat protein